MDQASDTRPRSRLTLGRAFCLAWLVFTLLYSLQSYTFNLAVGRSQAWRTFLGLELVFIATLAVQTPLIVALGRRYPIVGAGRWRRILRHLAAAMVLAFAQRFLVEAISRSVRATPDNPFNWTRVAQATLGSFETGVFVYFLVLLAMHFWDYYERYSEERLRAAHLKADLSAAQLEALRTQVQPHFLFNTLNAISVLIEEDPKTARTMIGQLGDFLRATLSEDSRQEISLQRELELLEHYLRIEQTRFGDRLRIDTKIAPDALQAQIPALLLQPLVENAIRHGFSKRPGPGCVEIEASVRGDALVVAVRDYGLSESPVVVRDCGLIESPAAVRDYAPIENPAAGHDYGPIRNRVGGRAYTAPTSDSTHAGQSDRPGSGPSSGSSLSASAWTSAAPAATPSSPAFASPASTSSSAASNPPPSGGLGIGLRNTQARLRELYGEAQELVFCPIVENGCEIGTEVTVSIGQGNRA